MRDRNDSNHQDGVPGAASGSTHGAGAGTKLDTSGSGTDHVNEEPATSPLTAEFAPRRTPTAAHSASRTSPSAGVRGTGGGLGDAAGGARQGKAREITGGSATPGAAVGAGMSRGAADPHPPSSADPGGGGDLTGDTIPRGGTSVDDPTETGLGDTNSGGRLQDFDSAIRGKPKPST